jgi:putative tryptophan/tyrosine transport system substrate-binding protein
VLLVFGAPCQHKTLVGREHGRTIPLPEVDTRKIFRADRHPDIFQLPSLASYTPHSDPLGAGMDRRQFIGLVGGAAAGPLAAHAQQPSIPVVGFLGVTTAESTARSVEAFRRGLSETGFVDGHSVKIEYRWAKGRYAELPAMAVDLVSRKVDAIVASGGSVAALAAKTATATIPIVFASVGADPIKVGLVPSLNRPGGNVTGSTIVSNELSAKKL